VLGLAALASPAQAQTPRLTFRVLGTNRDVLSGRTETNEASPRIRLEDKGQWFGVDADLRLVPWVSLDVAVSQGNLREVRQVIQPNDVLLRDRRSATLRHETLSVLFHPLSPEHRLALYFGPSLGRAHFSRAFAPDEDEFAMGGKVGFNVRLGETPWLFAAELSDLKSEIRISPSSSTGHVHYTIVAVGLGYSW